VTSGGDRHQSTDEAPFTPLMPPWFGSPELRCAVSSDGQFYLRDPASAAEYRLESWNVPQLDDDDPGEDLPGQISLQRVVRHLDHEHWRCADCGHDTEVVSFGWTDRRCPKCWSSTVEVLERRTTPARPGSFGNLGRPVLSWHNSLVEFGPHEWGQSADDDARTLVKLFTSYMRQEAGHPHLYALSLFCRTLTDIHSRSADRFNLLLNVANVNQAYLRATGFSEAAGARSTPLTLPRRQRTNLFPRR
jgi:hypothetical protein